MSQECDIRNANRLLSTHFVRFIFLFNTVSLGDVHCTHIFAVPLFDKA